MLHPKCSVAVWLVVIVPDSTDLDANRQGTKEKRDWRLRLTVRMQSRHPLPTMHTPGSRESGWGREVWLKK